MLRYIYIKLKLSSKLQTARGTFAKPSVYNLRAFTTQLLLASLKLV
jgi:hypothetical protein